MTTWIATTQTDKLVDRTADVKATGAVSSADLQLDGKEYQALRGFGGCFNELGWLPLQTVTEEERAQIIKELFSPDEMNFTFNRAPVGANDFADHWYSYNETEGDYEMEHFSVARDEETLIPYIHSAQKWQPDMQLFSSPWSPPTWMKKPKAYNYGRLVDTPENLTAYAKYFVKYIQAYAEHGIDVTQLHVQNEVFADQKFPSCLWTSDLLKTFIRDYLGPAFEEAGLDTDIWLGTLNGPEDMAFTGGYGMKLDNYNRFVDNILFDENARKYIKGIAYQWAGRDAIQRTHESWPEIELIQSESECGNGENSWEYAEYVFHLINHYLRNGATAYTYWNMILDDQDSTWGWWQNSLFTITADTHEIRRNPEYYVMRHFSQYVRPGAKVLGTTGHFNSMAIAFRNPDGSVVVAVQNALDYEMPFSFADPENPERSVSVTLDPRSFNTFVL
ncbi:glycoside hydrolase family 30 protein [Bifidobacterium simiarum]|uniref:glycoside hydrolase family 30 protein n=1 Tax=Bifidobacterium simiarum TaxID=2045441 RepID=UPI001BDCA8E4|nr:glycoside hydrolase family 30 protein [Bifidobacterium simiarum]MBT1166588.1 glycoside hydrolase family 30 protein [Bifidobacterium simiarum]